MLSFWEKKSFLQYDYIIVGSGLMGLHVAYELIEKHPTAKIVILERGIFPTGASTKNAGFACFGSLTEIISDIAINGVGETLDLLEERFRGIDLLCDRLGKKNIDYQLNGGYELIFEKEKFALERREEINALLWPIFKTNVFELSPTALASFGFDATRVKALLYNRFEGQIDTGLMMQVMMQKVMQKGVQILTGSEVTKVEALGDGGVVHVHHHLIDEDIQMRADKVFVCTNAFVNGIVSTATITPGRGQVLVTKPISGLPFKGVFHFDEGYYYFRNYEDRVIFGGGRNLDFATEASHQFALNEEIFSQLTRYLQEIILPHHSFEIEDRWSGIMGFSADKKPVIQKEGEHIVVSMSCNGMGVALSGICAKKAVLLSE
jgi:glycine/D-amino acid oxidase-like deaminating enzyme